MAVLQTATMSDVAVPSGSCVAPGGVVARAVLISAVVGAGTSQTVSQSGRNFTFAGNISRQTSRAKAGTSPSSGVTLAKDGVTYFTPYMTRMWGVGGAKRMRSRGRLVRG